MGTRHSPSPIYPPMLPKGAFHPGKPLLPHSSSCLLGHSQKHTNPIAHRHGILIKPPQGQGDVGWLWAYGSIPVPPSRTSLGHHWDTKWGHLSRCPGGNTGRAGCPQMGAVQPCPGATLSALKTQCPLSSILIRLHCSACCSQLPPAI